MELISRMLSSLDPILGSLLSILGILVIVFGFIRKFRRRSPLCWSILPPKSMMEIADEIADSIAISYKGRKVSNLIRYQFILHNRGFESLKGEAITKPITWQGPGQILSAKVVATEPQVELQLESEDSTLKVSWELFNWSSKAVIEVLCEEDTANDSSTDQKGRISGQIENVPVIKEKQIWWRDEDEILRQMQANLAMQSPRIIQKFNKIFVNRRILRAISSIVRGYVVFQSFIVVCIVVSLVLYELVAQSVISTVAAIFVAALAALLFCLYLWFRNPYASILRKARANKASTKIAVPNK